MDILLNVLFNFLDFQDVFINLRGLNFNSRLFKKNLEKF